jgi:hypothetical protein
MSLSPGFRCLRRFRLLGLVVLGLPASVACTENGEAPPYWEGGGARGPASPGGARPGGRGGAKNDDGEGTGGDMGDTGGTGGTDAAGGTGGTDAADGTGGTEGAVAEWPTTLAVRELDEDFGLGSRNFADDGTVHLRLGSGGWSSTKYQGSPIDLEATGSALWAAFVPKSDKNHFITIRQLTPLSPVLAVARRRTFQDIFQALSVPADPDPLRAQILVRVTNRRGEPLAFVIPQVRDARVIMYRTFGSWTEFGEQTSGDGMFLAADVPASSFPGSIAKVILSGAVSASFEVPVAAGAVTLFDAAVD